MKFSSRINTVAPSPTLAATAKANELKAAGEDVVSFTVGEPDFDTPEHIKAAAKKAIDEGFTKYTAVPGIPELKKVLQEKFKRDQGINYSASELIVTNGGKQALAALFAVLLNEGDEVIIPAPYWTSYPDMVSLAGGIPKIINTKPENEFLASVEEIKQALTEKTRAIIINSPSNPTGSCYSEEHLSQIADLVRTIPKAQDLIVVSDEVYEYITYDGFKHVSFASVAPDLRENTVIVNAFSKAYSMTGWRVGYAAGPEAIIKKISTHQSQFTSNVCSIAQKAAVAAYEDNYDFPKMMATEFAKRLDYVCDYIERIPGLKLAAKPKGAFYAYVITEDIVGKKAGDRFINSSDDLASYLLENYKVVVVQGEAFGFPNSFRISFATSMATLEKGLKRIEEAILALN